MTRTETKEIESVVCGEPIPKDERIKKIRTIVESKGKAWLIAAMIDGSIGYHSAKSAQLMIDATLERRTRCCERTAACFSDDPIAEILFDAGCFERKEEYAPEKVKLLVQAVPKLLGISPIQAMTLSMAYPTMGI